MTDDSLWVHLDQPPTVVNHGRAVHGVHGLVDHFRLPHLWSLHLYSYRAELIVGTTSHQIAPGTLSLVPPQTDITYRYQGPSTHLYTHLQIDSRPGPTPPSRLRTVMSPGADLPMITDLMHSAVASGSVHPARSRADVWQVLLRLAEVVALPTRPSAPGEHVMAAMAQIESRLPEPIRVPEVAAAIGISANHLTRVFRQVTGETVVGYVRRRRIDQARQLLASSTMSIPAIAASVGLADLQAFNKACRAVTGRSPRSLRAG